MRRVDVLRQPLDDHRHSLAAADAHGLDAERLVVGRKVIQQRGGNPGSGHAERMPERDRATGDVELVLVDAQFPR